MKTIAERLRAAMDQSEGLQSQYALSAASTVPQPTIKRILDGASKDPKTRTLMLLSRFLRVRSDWLRHGTGPMRPVPGEFEPSLLYGTKEEELQMEQADQEHLDWQEHSHLYGKGHEGNTSRATGPARTFYYPEISDVAAGNAIEAIDLLQPGEGERHQSDAWAGNHGFWLRVRGDSMTRSSGISFPEGMIVLVFPDAEPEPGQFIVAKNLNNEVTFKQYIVDAGMRYLKPLNPAYQQQVMDERWSLIGRVVDAKWPRSAF